MEFISYIVAKMITVFIIYFIYRYIPYAYLAANSEFFSDTIFFGSSLLVYAIIYPTILKSTQQLNFIQCVGFVVLIITTLLALAYCIDTMSENEEDAEE